MNKLLGFYELRRFGIPTVKWSEYTDNAVLDATKLWTIRLAVVKGKDINLPRAVGVRSEEAHRFAREARRKFPSALIVYYPYFIADKSGTLQISEAQSVIETVDKDLWNLVTYGKWNARIICRGECIHVEGDADFLSESEIHELAQADKAIRMRLRNELKLGQTFVLEWSFAVDTDTSGERLGSPYLVFYECRAI